MTWSATLVALRFSELEKLRVIASATAVAGSGFLLRPHWRGQIHALGRTGHRVSLQVLRAFVH